VTFEARVVCRAQPDVSASSAVVLEPPLVVTRATGTVVVP
jgi:3-aminobutyryl-CoA ammonia-lyase